MSEGGDRVTLGLLQGEREADILSVNNDSCGECATADCSSNLIHKAFCPKVSHAIIT